MNQRIGVIGIIIKDREKAATDVNDLLSLYGNIIVGRMGVPYKKKGFNVIALIVDGTTDEIGALTGKLGMIEKVEVKSALTTS